MDWELWVSAIGGSEADRCPASGGMLLSIGHKIDQYILAVDRSNRKVADLYEPLHPAVLAALKSTIDTGKRAGKRVGMCGEMAGDPLSALLLLGMGLEEFSMGSLYIPAIKKTLRSISYQDAKAAARLCCNGHRRRDQALSFRADA